MENAPLEKNEKPMTKKCRFWCSCIEIEGKKNKYTSNVMKNIARYDSMEGSEKLDTSA